MKVKFYVKIRSRLRRLVPIGGHFGMGPAHAAYALRVLMKEER